MYIDSKFISNFAPEMEDDQVEKLHLEYRPELDQDLLNNLTTNVHALIENQGILEDKYNFFFNQIPTNDLEKEKEARDQPDEKEDKKDKEDNVLWKRSRTKCQRDLEKNTKNLVRALLESENLKICKF